MTELIHLRFPLRNFVLGYQNKGLLVTSRVNWMCHWVICWSILFGVIITSIICVLMCSPRQTASQSYYLNIRRRNNIWNELKQSEIIERCLICYMFVFFSSHVTGKVALFLLIHVVLWSVCWFSYICKRIIFVLLCMLNSHCNLMVKLHYRLDCIESLLIKI